MVCLASVLWLGAADAQESPKLSVSPHTFDLKVKRGETVKNKIHILNQSGFPIPMLAKTTDFSAEDRTGQMRLDNQGEDPSFAAKKWLKIKTPNFILDQGETETVDFFVEVPKNAEPGGHYAAVLFEPQLPSGYFKEGEPRVIPVIGVIFLFSVEVPGAARSDEPITIAEFNIPEEFHLKKLEDSLLGVTGLFSEAKAGEGNAFSIVETSYLPLALRIKNNDIYHSKPYGELVITGNGGKVLGKNEINKTTILPGKIREIPVSFQPESFLSLKKYLPPALYDFLSRNLVWGKYQARLSLNTDSGAIMEKNIEFWVFPWKSAVITIVLLIAIFLARKRIMMAGRILLVKRET